MAGIFITYSWGACYQSYWLRFQNVVVKKFQPRVKKIRSPLKKTLPFTAKINVEKIALSLDWQKSFKKPKIKQSSINLPQS